MRSVHDADPSGLIESAYRSIHKGRMRGLPLLNPALCVEAVAFRPWNAYWLGILVTPWFMNLMLLPREAGHAPPIDPGASVSHSFPAGCFDFIAGRDDELGAYQACSLFSPMFQFSNQDAARLTAHAVMGALFNPNFMDADSPHEQRPDREAAGRLPPAGAESLTRRAFLHGGFFPEPNETGR